MNKFKQLITSIFVKKNWIIRVSPWDAFTLIEVTDPSFLLVRLEDLLYDVIENAFRDYRYLSISQVVDRDQWSFGEPQEFLEDISNNFSFPIEITKEIDAFEEAKASEGTFAIHVICPPEQRWIRKVVRFGMTSNPNIIYGLQSIPKNWPIETIQWNIGFRKWFWLEDDSQFKEIFNYVTVFGWTGDGHFNVGLNNKQAVNSFLLDINRLAQEKSLGCVSFELKKELKKELKV